MTNNNQYQSFKAINFSIDLGGSEELFDAAQRFLIDSGVKWRRGVHASNTDAVLTSTQLGVPIKTLKLVVNTDGFSVTSGQVSDALDIKQDWDEIEQVLRSSARSMSSFGTVHGFDDIKVDSDFVVMTWKDIQALLDLRHEFGKGPKVDIGVQAK